MSELTEPITFTEKLKMLDITRDKPVKVSVKVAVPVRDHPKVSQIPDIIRLMVITFCHLPVQFCWQATGTEGQLDETAPGGHNV